MFSRLPWRENERGTRQGGAYAAATPPYYVRVVCPVRTPQGMNTTQNRGVHESAAPRCLSNEGVRPLRGRALPFVTV